MKSLVVIAGEISGDTHGAELLRALPDVCTWNLSGLGGPKMEALTGTIQNWLDEAAVLGLIEVKKNTATSAKRWRKPWRTFTR